MLSKPPKIWSKSTIVKTKNSNCKLSGSISKYKITKKESISWGIRFKSKILPTPKPSKNNFSSQLINFPKSFKNTLNFNRNTMLSKRNLRSTNFTNKKTKKGFSKRITKSRRPWKLKYKSSLITFWELLQTNPPCLRQILQPVKNKALQNIKNLRTLNWQNSKASRTIKTRQSIFMKVQGMRQRAT